MRVTLALPKIVALGKEKEKRLFFFFLSFFRNFALMTVEELFGRCQELAEQEPSVAANRFMHETLGNLCFLLAEGHIDKK